MEFPRGLSAQALYLVETTAASAVEKFKTFDPSRYPELEVFQQHTFRAEGDGRFATLKIDAKAAPFQRLLNEMAAPKNLQFLAAERARLPRTKDVAAAQQFWAELLHDRWTRFARDGNVEAVGNFDPRGEIRSLLKEEPKLAAHFAALLKPWTNADSGPGSAATAHYWDSSNTEGLANFEVGVIFERTDGERLQLADVTYYSSSGYLAAVSLFEFIPIAGGATPQTLVWHGTLLSSADVAGGFGLRRKFAIRTLESEMRQWIGIYRRVCSGKTE